MISIVHEDQNNRIAAYDGEELIGVCEYAPSASLWIASHTHVEDGYAGQGIGARMVKLLTEVAREQNKKILPLCPYVKHVFDKTPEYEDLRA
ncbi:MAG: GNAT family N-acetyltransferase [Eubacteriales bacterium]|nr:GNAT family N-acetyltransferase [Eubacteriales bacterium]